MVRHLLFVGMLALVSGLPSVGLTEGGESPVGEKPKVPVRARPVVKIPRVAKCCFDRDLKDIERAVMSQSKSIKHCYERGLKSNGPGLDGRVVLGWVILPDGGVDAVEVTETTLDAPDVEACFVAAIKKWHFEPGETPCDVSFPFVFKSQE